MDITIQPRQLQGQVKIIPSKSQAHRLLISAAFADRETILLCPHASKDIAATADCLNALGADITRTDLGYHIVPIAEVPETAVLNCCESGSTLRFLLPIVGALGVDAVFQMEGRLSQRPLSPLWEEMERMGNKLEWLGNNQLHCFGNLHSGEYRIDGGVSSQFITGLLFAASLMEGNSNIAILGKLESKNYVAMTQQAMALFGVQTENFSISGGQTYRSPGEIAVEGDWSNGAFWLVAQALGNDVQVLGLDENSAQGDRTVLPILAELKNRHMDICVADIPDLVPVLAVAASAFQGATFTGIRRLRLKESDRVASTVSMIEQLGCRAEATEDTLTVYPGILRGGIVDACNDHRIAMAAAIAATVCKEPVAIMGAHCVAKSYPGFWEEYQLLGGNYA
ncbi:MAG: 3-phosphoshikimate 1-carboxyvinyltransferase [Oscillospiraceae bacterium]|nr:3-phosphoshikimate 1-carboxyvinyltransferase [Oscillospiraceae bacterium]